MAVPGLFEPVNIKGRTYVDAGAMESVPVKAVQQLTKAPIIAVDVGCLPQMTQPPRHTGEVFARYLDIVQCETVLNDTIRADLVIHVPHTEVFSWDFSQAEPIIDAGRKAAETALPAIINMLSKGN